MRTPLAILMLLALSFGSASLVLAQSKPQMAGDRSSVDLTVYNVNLALVREERQISLAKGFNIVLVPDVPATIDGTSVHFASLTDPAAVRVLEQNFQYDLVHHAKLLEKYLGKEIEFVRLNPKTEEEFTVRGTLLATGWQQQPSYDGGGYTVPVSYSYAGQMIAEIDGKIEIAPAGRIVLPNPPEGLILKPRLQWLVNSTAVGTQKVEISYLAGKLSWACDYVALLNQQDSKLDLTGWVTLTNGSGTAFTNAGLKLVAGDVSIVKKGEYERDYAQKAMAVQIAAEPQFQQKELFEYKLYSLQRRTDIGNNETKQIELTSARDIAAKKVFIYDGLADFWRSWWNNYSYRDQGTFGQQSNPKVGAFVTFKNEEKTGLGIPLPKGKVRVYKRDDEGKEQFIGEDEIDHTPKDEEIRLYLGNAFDLVGSRAQKDFRVIVSGHVIEESFEIKVRNHKTEDTEVLVYEHPWRWNQWEITKSSTDYEKVDQSTIRFPVKIKKDGEKVVTYTIRYTW